MINKKIKHLFLYSIIIFSYSTGFAALPENISELVDKSAPAVVNITAKKKYLRDLHMDMVVFLMKCSKGLAYQENSEKCLNKEEKQHLMVLDSY